MNIKNIREMLEEKPFVPFQIYVADGRAIPVEHPELVFFPPSNQEVLVYQRDNSFDFIDAFQITSLKQRRKSHSKSNKG